MHHIVPLADGGENTYDNAIVLCFDCHADAGHYNPKHPKGTKFSLGELRKAKEKWIQMVKDDKIASASEPDHILCRYYVCESYDQLMEISNKDLSNFPEDNPLLIENDILGNLRMIIQRHSESYRHASLWGNTYKDMDAYKKKYSDINLYKKLADDYPAFKATRIPTKEELQSLAKDDAVLGLMLDHGLPIEDISVVSCYKGECNGSDGVQEEYLLRQLWGVFLALTNISDQPIRLDTIIGEQHTVNGFMPFMDGVPIAKEINLPTVQITSGQSVVFPIGLVMPPLKGVGMEVWSTISKNLDIALVQSIEHCSANLDNWAGTHTYGNLLLPNAISYEMTKNMYKQEIHKFDFTNMYRVDRHWQMGSCPHLFFITDNIVYKGEILAHCESSIGEDVIEIPPGVKSILIAELEEEITEIKNLYVNNDLCMSNAILRKGGYLHIPVPENATVKIVGQYIPNGPYREDIPKGAIRNALVNQFMYDYAGHQNDSSGRSYTVNMI